MKICEKSFFDSDSSTLMDSPDKSSRKRTLAILRRQAPFIALVNRNREFKGLVDRDEFLKHIAVRLAESSDGA